MAGHSGDRLAPGAGRPELIVLVHGGLDRHQSMARLAAACAPLGAEVIRYDRRGYGSKVAHPGPFSVSANVGDLIDIIGGRPSVVFGHSFGGVLAVAASVSEPAVRAVATYEAPLSWLEWWPSPQWSADGIDGAGAAEAFIRRLAGDRAWESLPEAAKTRRRTEGRVLLEELADCRRRAPCNLAQVTAQLRVGRGARGRPHHRRGSEILAASVAGATLVEIEGAGHFAHRTHPREVAELLIAPLMGESR